jgi:hypothetical protein
MIKNAYFILICIFLSFLSSNAYAVYFTIQLTNGNKIKTEKYTQKDQTICFYIDAGSVRLPNKIIKQIATSNGIMGSKTLYYPSQLSSEISENEQLTEETGEDKKKTEIIAELKDRISITEANIENLVKNIGFYLRKKERYNKDKERADERNEAIIRGDLYLDSKDRKERGTLEQNKIMDAENKTKEVEQQIKSTEKMLENQKRMKKRLQKELEQTQKT